jgi:hypothetical protein
MLANQHVFDGKCRRGRCFAPKRRIDGFSMEIQRASQVRETPCQPFKKPQNDNDYYFGATTFSITTFGIMTVTIKTHTISDKNVTLSIKLSA